MVRPSTPALFWTLSSTVPVPSSRRSVAKASIDVSIRATDYLSGRSRSSRSALRCLLVLPFDHLFHHLHVAGGESPIDGEDGAGDQAAPSEGQNRAAPATSLGLPARAR